MELRDAKPGDKLQLDTGALVELLGPVSADGRTAPVRFVDAPFGPEKPGAERDVTADEVYGVFPGGDLSRVR